MSKVKKTFIDGNSVGFASSQAGVIMKAGDQEVQGVFLGLKTLRKIMASRADGKFLILWDGNSWRKSEFAGYKAQRDKTAKDAKMRASYKSQAPYLRRALQSLGITQAVAYNLEADDLAAMLTERAVARGEQVTLITRDRDWQQLVRPGVTWLDHSDFSRVSHKNFQEVTGYADRFRFSQAKALQGDASDNIPGVGRIGEGRAKTLLEHWPTVDEFLADTEPEAKLGGKLLKCFRDFRELPERQETFRRNHKLMDLTDPSHLPKPENLKIQKGELDLNEFRKVCNELGFHSILKDFDAFVTPFEEIGAN